MSSSTTSFFVPTLDIDLVWHTHQLLGAHYQRDCKQYVGRYIDHDDKVEQTHLANAFDLTCRAWNVRFSVPCMHCGCPLPGDTVGQKLSRLVARLGLKYDAPLTPPEHPDILAASHPSDHSSVKVPDLPHLAARTHVRDAKMRRRRERDAERMRQGRMSRETYERGQAHKPAFWCPCRFTGAVRRAHARWGRGALLVREGAAGFQDARRVQGLRAVEVEVPVGGVVEVLVEGVVEVLVEGAVEVLAEGAVVGTVAVVAAAVAAAVAAVGEEVVVVVEEADHVHTEAG